MTRRVIPSQKLPDLTCEDANVQRFVNDDLRKHVAEVYQQFARTSAWEIQVVNGEVTITSEEADLIVLDATKVRSGDFTDPSYFGGNPGFAHAGSGAASFGNFARYESGTISGPSLGLMKSRNDTPDAHTIVQANDQVGDLSYFGSDGANWQCLARIFGEVDGTPGTNDMPGRLTFYTTADGGNTQFERMRIDNAGVITLGTTSATPTHKLNTNTASTVGAAGGASALPATPTGYVVININGTDRKIPYYAT